MALRSGIQWSLSDGISTSPGSSSGSLIRHTLDPVREPIHYFSPVFAFERERSTLPTRREITRLWSFIHIHLYVRRIDQLCHCPEALGALASHRSRLIKIREFYKPSHVESLMARTKEKRVA